MKKLFIIPAILICSLKLSYAQIKVASDNNVGIGVDAPISKLSVGDVGNAYAKSYFFNSNSANNSRGGQFLQEIVPGINSWGYGLVCSSKVGSTSGYSIGASVSAYSTTAYSSPKTFGLYATAGNGAAGYNYGTFSRLYGNSNGAAFFAAVGSNLETNVQGIWAAYLRGKVYIEDKVGILNLNPQYTLDVTGDINASGNLRCKGVIVSSDLNLKNNVKDLAPGSLTKITQLKGVSYRYNLPTDLVAKMASIETSDTGRVEEPVKIPNPELYETDQIGLIAQDVQKLFPQLVTTDKAGNLGINYTGLIPVLIEALKEQQSAIELMKAQIVVLNQKLKIPVQQ